MVSAPGRPPLDRPLVIAHRGASLAEPEHTHAAYVRALAAGADGLECDVRLTADRQLVCVHDRSLRRTSNGHGVVSALTLAELQAYDWGSWKHATGEVPELLEGSDRTSVLTLDRFLDTALAHPTPLTLLIETKHPNRRGGEVEHRLAKALADRGLLGSTLSGPHADHTVHVMSFSWLGTARAAQLMPGVGAVLILDRRVPRVGAGWLPEGAAALGLKITAIMEYPKIVRAQHEAGHRVYAWTVNTPEDVDLCLELGVDALITDDPAGVLARVDGVG